MTLRHWADDALAEAAGRDRRVDPVLPGHGGPAGNARLTAWTGFLLLALFLVELVTLLDLNGLISWHIVAGTLLVPPALLKTASTGWRILRYYTHRPPYRQAGPPPMPLRILGPLVVLCTLAVLGSGLALIALGPGLSRSPFLSVFGYSVDALTVHQGTFVGWAVVTGLHTLGRLVPATRVIGARGEPVQVPGRLTRTAVLGLAMLVAAITSVVVLDAANAWVSGGSHRFGHHREVTDSGQ